MKISNIFFSCGELSDSICTVCISHLAWNVGWCSERAVCTYRNAAFSLIDPLGADLCFVLSSLVLSYSVCIPFHCILYSYTAFLLAVFPLSKQIFFNLIYESK